MPFSTLGVVSTITPALVSTYLQHVVNRAPLRGKPQAHISYHEGLRLIREFLDYSSKHTVEDLQAFTAQWVPVPTWVRSQDVDIGAQYLERSARMIQEQLGPKGIELVGGKTWWQWRRPDAPCKAEWVEMKKDYNERKRTGEKCDKAILYVHGGAYYFGSVDEHRYQMQRHARKLKAKVFAPRYRLAPQFPFPCGLQDCIAAYLQLLEDFEPSQILFAGDSAGGGMVLSMLVTLRDQGQPLPAGTILLSPWVDLTHSFPSVAGDGVGDYIPPHGFHHKPSMVWPPPNTDELRDLAATPIKKKKSKDELSSMSFPDQGKVPHADRDLTIYVNGENITIKDQIQMYSTNHMLAHPLVSPVQQASLGGLPPMLIQVGGAELLRDEQMYVAHKAANPTAYPPSQSIMNEYGIKSEDVSRYPPTDVQLQVWDDLCHVPHTLSFTRPAKYMYRSVAQFGAWALGQAQRMPVPPIEDDQISIISSGTGTDNESSTNVTGNKSRGGDHIESFRPSPQGQKPNGTVGRAGDPLPQFEDHMIRQRVDRHGVTYPLAPQSELKCLHLDPESIGAIKSGPVGKWLKHKRDADSKFAGDKKKVQKKRLKEIQQGYALVGEGEYPPPTALAGRRTADMPAAQKLKKSWGLAMWSGWGSSHDETVIERQDKLEKDPSLRPESRQPGTNLPAAETAGFKPFGSDEDGRRRAGSTSSVVSGRSKMEDRSVSPFVAGSEDRAAAGGSNLRPPSETISRTVSRTSSRFSATASQRNAEIPARTTSVMESSKSNLHTSSTPDDVTTAPRVQSPTKDRVKSPTNIAASEGSSVVGRQETPLETPQETSSDIPAASSNMNDGPLAYPFKIRNPIPGYTSSAASSTGAGEASDVQTSSTLFPNATSNSRPISSLHAFSDKEFVMQPAEKEVSMDSASNPSTPTDGRNMPFRMRNHPSVNGLNTNGLTTVTTNSSQVSSIPASPAGGQYRNPAFDPRNVASRVFGASPQHEMSNPYEQIRVTPPKPMGFAYNPRDLRNAMLNRAAAENAAAASASIRGDSPAPPSSARSQYYQSSPAFGDPVELPAIELPASAVQVSHRPSHETLGRESMNSRASNHPTPASATATTGDTPSFNFNLPDPDPVELSAVPASRKPAPTASAPSSSTAARKDLSVKENITLPVPEQQQQQQRPNSRPPPPLPPKDDPSPDQRPPPRSPIDFLGASTKPSDSQTVSSSRVQTKAPVIGDIPGLRDESGKGLDLGLGGVNGNDEDKPPAWL
jgi:acetyl esterase/lipase